jgi:hypothetical protein
LTWAAVARFLVTVVISAAENRDLAGMGLENLAFDSDDIADIEKF